MAELAKNYYENLQFLKSKHEVEHKEEKIKDTLNNIKMEPNNNQLTSLTNDISESEVIDTLRLSKDRLAAGLDGSIYKLWKKTHAHYIKEEKAERHAFSIVLLLKNAFNDIKEHSVDAETDFVQGWMCLLYKKNDKNLISNYWPIILLNTDYKIFTKILAVRLAEVAPSIIHKNQAGFIKGRSISEYTKLIRMVIEYVKVTETNGLIITLDQEKAYNKINHEYLWRVLDTFKIPTPFTNMIKTLYCYMKIKVMVNRHMSLNFRVVRGVCQGNPLLCLLFNLAIELLAATLRKSDLEGMNISETEEKLITKLFANDIMIVLSENNDFAILQKILDDWCIASKAKFNVGKTEVISIETEEFRGSVITTRKQKPHLTEINQSIWITLDKNMIRILRAWFRN